MLCMLSRPQNIRKDKYNTNHRVYQENHEIPKESSMKQINVYIISARRTATRSPENIITMLYQSITSINQYTPHLGFSYINHVHKDGRQTRFFCPHGRDYLLGPPRWGKAHVRHKGCTLHVNHQLTYATKAVRYM